MDGIVSAVMSMKAEQVQRTLSYALLSKAMESNVMIAESLIEQLPESGKPMRAMEGEPGFSFDIFA